MGGDPLSIYVVCVGYMLALSCGKKVGYGNQLKERPPFIELLFEIIKGCQGGKVRMADANGCPMVHGMLL